MIIGDSRKANPTIVALAPNDWDGLWMNRQQLMSRIGISCNAYYSTGIGHLWDRAKILKERGLFWSDVCKDSVTVMSAPCYVMRYEKNKIIDAVALKIFASKINRKRTSSPLVLYVFHPDYLDYINFIDYDYLIYHCYDDFVSMPGSDKDTKQKEHTLCDKADLIFASSKANVERFERDYLCKADFIPNGVNYKMFSDTNETMPSSLNCINKHNDSRKKIGYVGSLNDKVDFKLLEKLVNSEQLRDHLFCFVGRVNNLSKENSVIWDSIKNKDNVFSYPSVAKEDVPSILRNMDVNCIYYDLSGDNYSSSGYPLKLHEYLASGKPVVASGIESVLEFKDSVNIPKDEDEWVSLLLNSTRNPESAPSNSEHRQLVAKSNDWNERVRVIFSKITSIID